MKATLIAVSASVLLTSHCNAGYQLTVKSTTENDQSSQNANTILMTTAGEKARIDFTEGQMTGSNDGGYLITKDAGKTFYMVSPKDKTFMKWDMDSMMGMAGAMGNMMNMKVSDPKVEKVLDESGPAILGYPTRHYKFRTSYHMSMSVMGFKNEMNINNEDESWTTTKLDISTMGAWFNKTPKTQNPEMNKLIEAHKSQMTGVPLKTISVQTSTDSQGKASVTQTKMEVTEIKTMNHVPVEIPEDYQEMNLLETMGQATPDDSSSPTPQKQSAPKFNIGGFMRKALESAK